MNTEEIKRLRGKSTIGHSSLFDDYAAALRGYPMDSIGGPRTGKSAFQKAMNDTLWGSAEVKHQNQINNTIQKETLMDTKERIENLENSLAEAKAKLVEESKPKQTKVLTIEIEAMETGYQFDFNSDYEDTEHACSTKAQLIKKVTAMIEGMA